MEEMTSDQAVEVQRRQHIMRLWKAWRAAASALGRQDPIAVALETTYKEAWQKQVAQAPLLRQLMETTKKQKEVQTQLDTISRDKAVFDNELRRWMDKKDALCRHEAALEEALTYYSAEATKLEQEMVMKDPATGQPSGDALSSRHSSDLTDSQEDEEFHSVEVEEEPEAAGAGTVITVGDTDRSRSPLTVGNGRVRATWVAIRCMLNGNGDNERGCWWLRRRHQMSLLPMGRAGEGAAEAADSSGFLSPMVPSSWLVNIAAQVVLPFEVVWGVCLKP